MVDIPTEQPVEPRRDPGAADVDTQADLGWVEPQPEPEPPTPVEPPAPAEQDAPSGQ
ncbi:hypothetical protein ACWDXD_20205 [Streptomyces sp. NPDC003314]